MAEVNKEEERGADTDKWGYAVCLGTVITFIAGIGHVNSFGLIYNDFIKDTNSTAKFLTTAHGVFAFMLAIGGLILNVISKKRSLRLGGFVGAFTFAVGSMSTVFISNTNQLTLTFGILQGVGFGMMVPVCYSTVNFYFVRKRTTVMSACKAVQGLILMGYPQLLRNILSTYGFRGTLLIISGISMHTIAGMAVMRIDDRRPGIKKTETNAVVSIWSEVAICISICAGADVAGRCALALLSSLVPVDTRLLFYAATLLTLVTRIVVLQIRSFLWMCVVTGTLGVLRACLHVASPLVVASHVAHADFPGAYALFMLSTGVVNVLCAPVIGLLKDVYQDYVPAFYALAACCAPCLLFWPVEYIIKRKSS